MAPPAPNGTLLCFMCQGVMFVKDKNRFIQHMNNEHGVIFEVDFLFACCRLKADQRDSFRDMVEEGLKTESGVDFSLESVKEKLEKIIPQLTMKPTGTNSSMPITYEEAEEGIEFVTSVSAESKKRKGQEQEKQDKKEIPPVKRAKKEKMKSRDVPTVTSVMKDIERLEESSHEDEVRPVERASVDQIVNAPVNTQVPNREDEVIENIEEADGVLKDLSNLVQEIQDNLSEADLSVSLGSDSSFDISNDKMNVENLASEPLELPLLAIENPKETPKRGRKPRGTDSSKKRSVSKKLSSEVCDICNQTFLNSKGLYIHKSRMHKEVNSPSVKACKVDLKPIKSAEHGLELEEAPETSETDKSESELITRNLFLDNVGSDNEDEELEIVDFVKKPVVQEGVSVEELMKDSPYFSTHTTMLEQCSVQVKEMFVKEIKFLPGWKMRKTIIDKGNGHTATVTNFLTPAPDTIVLRSGVAVLEYLRIKGETMQALETLVEKMKLKEKNWTSYKEQYLKC